MKSKLVEITKEEAKDYGRVCGSYGKPSVESAYDGLIKWMGMSGKGELLQAVKYYTKDMNPSVDDPSLKDLHTPYIEFYTNKDIYEKMSKEIEDKRISWNKKYGREKS